MRVRSVRETLAGPLLLAACSPQSSPPRTADEPPHAIAARADALPGFVNRVWRVAASSGIEPGMLYVFISDGTLLIASTHGTPSLGRWRYAGDTLTLVEEGIAHPAAVLRQGSGELAIRFSGPGEPLTITFVPAAVP